MIKYYWTWDIRSYLDLTKDIDTSTQEGWDEYWELYVKHHGNSADFCEYFKAAVEEAKKHLSAPVIKGLKMQLPALEAGEFERIDLGDMSFYAWEEKEADNEQS